ncbi:cation transporting ATPase C-terminal domain-containing protein, partial [Metamycoplasma equirhinis]
VPLAAVQIVFLNLIYDFCCGAIPWDNVDKEFIQKPRKWEHKSIFKFMLWFGPISSVVDILTFMILFYVFIPSIFGKQYKQIKEVSDQIEFKQMFWTGWLV